MTSSSQSMFDLSDKRRKLLESMLQKKGLDLPRAERIPRRSAAGPPPVSFAQERLWFLDQLEPGGFAYNVPAAVHLKGHLEISALEQSLNAIVRRHEALRTTFATIGGRPVQVIAPALVPTVRKEDLRSLSASESESETKRIAVEEAQRPFDLSKGPLLRVTLLRCGEEDHVLVVVMHHIICDGWSRAVFIKEMATLYDAFLVEKPAQLPELPIQYADFAQWQREWLHGDALNEQISYWKERLGGKLPVLELPADRTRPAIESFRGAVESFVVSKKLTDSLAALGQRQGVTVFMLLLAVLKILLLRYTAQNDILVGSPIANRRRSEIEGLIGFFVNTLVLRTDLSGNPTFRQLLERVRDVSLGAYAHQDLPFEKLVEELHPERDMSRNPIFQVMFALQNLPAEPLLLQGLVLNPMQVDTGGAIFDLMLLMSEEGETLNGSFEYNTDLFDAATIARMAKHFQNLLEAVVANPDQPIWSLPLLGDGERTQLVAEWNRTEQDYDLSHCIHRLFEAQVERAPDAEAVAFEGEVLTYRKLNGRANQLAHYLQKLGVGPDVLVGVCVERSIDMIVGLLATLKAGGAAIALDPTYPKDRLAFIIEDAGAPVLLTQRSLTESLPDALATKVCLDSTWDQITKESEENLVSPVTADNLLYAIYTSGSTGVPKGIGMSHAAFLNLLYWQYEGSTLARSARTLQASTFGFCVSFQEIFSAWCSGSALILVSEATRRDIEGLANYLIENDVERLHLPFASLKHLSEICSGAERVPASLREVITAGEQLQVTHAVRTMFERLGNCSLHNQYGASETHVVSAFTLTDAPARWPTIPPAGRPIANTRIYILDPFMEPVPIGVSGEIYIGGVCLARCYLNDPEQTAEKFLPDPLGDRASERLYKTGDVARYLADGNINYLGRIDQQIKVRGFRVEPGEIEAVLRRHHEVRDVAVVPQADEHNNTRLIAYVVLVEERAGTISDLRNYLKSKLPDYMLPAMFVSLKGLPINANGKLDQQALPVPVQTRPELDEPFIAPGTPIEEILAGVWSEVLGVERVGVNDNFFELGGHSLLATQVMSRLREMFRVEIALRRLFESPTLAGLADDIRVAITRIAGAQAPPIRRASSPEPLLTSFAQERMWFLDQLEPGNPFYNVPAAIRFEGPLSVDTLERSLNEIIKRHEVLRTTIATLDGSPVQVVAPALTLALSVTDLSARPEEKRESELRRLILEQGQQPFDLIEGPLLRASLLRLEPETHVLLLTIHHIAFDGWSAGIFMREMGSYYSAFLSGGPVTLQPLPFQYADFARWQREWLQGEIFEAQLSYWKRHLAGVSMLKLPTDRLRPSVESFRGTRQFFTLSGDEAKGLVELSKREGVTLYMTLVAAFKVLLHRYSGQHDISIGTPIANRNRGEIEGLIGCFVNTLVLRTDLSGNPSFRQLLERVRDVSLGAYANQDLPFERLVEELHPGRDMSRNPIFQVMFVLHNNPMPAVQLPNLTLTSLEVDSEKSKFDLILSIMETAQASIGWLEYNTDLFDPATISRMIKDFQNLIRSIIADPQQHLSDLRLMAEADLEGLSPSDFPEAGMSQKDFEGLIRELSEIPPSQ